MFLDWDYRCFYNKKALFLGLLSVNRHKIPLWVTQGLFLSAYWSFLYPYKGGFFPPFWIFCFIVFFRPFYLNSFYSSAFSGFFTLLLFQIFCFTAHKSFGKIYQRIFHKNNNKNGLRELFLYLKSHLFYNSYKINYYIIILYL